MTSASHKGEIFLEDEDEEVIDSDDEYGHREITQEVRNRLRKLGMDPNEIIF